MIGISETEIQSDEQLSLEVVHIIEMCPTCWVTKYQWCVPGIVLIVRCGIMHTAKVGIFEDGVTDCIKCVMALPGEFCSHCGVPVEQRD